MNRIIQSLLSLITLLMLSFTLFAVTVSPAQDIAVPAGEYELATETPDVSMSSEGNELITQTEDAMQVDGWGTADYLCASIVKISIDPDEDNLSLVQIDNPLLKEIAGIYVKVNYANHYMPSGVTGPVTFNVKLSIRDARNVNIVNDATLSYVNESLTSIPMGHNIIHSTRYYKYYWSNLIVPGGKYTITSTVTGTNSGNNTVYSVSKTQTVIVDTRPNSTEIALWNDGPYGGTTQYSTNCYVYALNWMGRVTYGLKEGEVFPIGNANDVRRPQPGFLYLWSCWERYGSSDYRINLNKVKQIRNGLDDINDAELKGYLNSYIDAWDDKDQGNIALYGAKTDAFVNKHTFRSALPEEIAGTVALGDNEWIIMLIASAVGKTQNADYHWFRQDFNDNGTRGGWSQKLGAEEAKTGLSYDTTLYNHPQNPLGYFVVGY